MSLSFDNQSAINYAILASNRLHIGKPVSTEDARIAAIALKNNLVLVTRNTKNFLEIDGLTLVSPWEIT